MPKFTKQLLFFIFLFFLSCFKICYALELNAQQPIVVNGDKVEFFAEENKVIAEGNVKIEYGTSILTCDRITVYTKTKEAFAEGNVKLKDEKGTIEGNNIFYNFDTQLGKIVKGKIKMAPYYGIATEVEKFPTKFIMHNADITTCNLDKPHYHFHAKKIEMIPGKKVKARNVKFVVGKVPILYLPIFVQDLRDRRNGVSFTGGRSKEWGDYLLSNWRYHINDDLSGTLHYDWRANKGFGGGIDFELSSDNFGDILYHYYQVNEHLRGRGKVEPFYKDTERYKTEYRHKWAIGGGNNFVMEVSDYSDANFLKDYFYRQYEKEPQPRSYMLYSHSYPNATFSTMLQKRINQFFSETEKIPEVKLETINQKIGNSPFYFQNQSSAVGFTSRTAYTDQDEDVVRFDAYNKLSYPFKFTFLDLSPYVATRETLYSKDENGDENLTRNVFYSGIGISTKFYRTFKDVKINSCGLEINKLRHIITPSIGYDYTHQPTLPSYRLTTFDSIDSITKGSAATISLENKLQTKRDDQNVDFLTFIVTGYYDFKLEAHGDGFRDLMGFDLEVSPNSWLRYESDAQFDFHRRSFSTANFDLTFTLPENGSIGTGYRYAAGGEDSEIFNINFEYQLNPKWGVKGYHRFNFSENFYEEQEYKLTRDLHCWDVEFIVNTKRKQGVTFWVAFKLKAFPDLGLEFDKTHHQPKTR